MGCLIFDFSEYLFHVGYVRPFNLNRHLKIDQQFRRNNDSFTFIIVCLSSLLNNRIQSY